MTKPWPAHNHQAIGEVAGCPGCAFQKRLDFRSEAYQPKNNDPNAWCPVAQYHGTDKVRCSHRKMRIPLQ